MKLIEQVTNWLTPLAEADWADGFGLTQAEIDAELRLVPQPCELRVIWAE